MADPDQVSSPVPVITDATPDTFTVEQINTPLVEQIYVDTHLVDQTDASMEVLIESPLVEEIDAPMVHQIDAPMVHPIDDPTEVPIDTTTVVQINSPTLVQIDTPTVVQIHDPTVEQIDTSNIEIVEISYETTLYDTVETTVRDEGQMVDDHPEVIVEGSQPLVEGQEVKAEPDRETFIIIVGSSQRQQPKLVDSKGYSYTKHTNNKDGTITWRCSVRNTRMFCGTTVKQCGDKFVQGSRDHCHPGLPGEHISAQIRSQVKQKAQARVFQPARQIVDEVLICNIANMPFASLPNPRNLTRLANRSRKRQKDEKSKSKRGRSKKHQSHKHRRKRSSSSSSSSSCASRGRSKRRKKHKRHRSYTSSSSSSYSSSSDSSDSSSSSSRERKRHKKKKRRESRSKRRHKKHKRKSKSKKKKSKEKMSGLSQLSKYMKERQKKTKKCDKEVNTEGVADSSHIKEEN